MTQDNLTSYGLSGHGISVAGGLVSAAVRKPWALDPRRAYREPGKCTCRAQHAEKGPIRGRGPSRSCRPRGARSAFVGWDLGRNDHTDEADAAAPRSFAADQLTRSLTEMHVVTRMPGLRQRPPRPHRRLPSTPAGRTDPTARWAASTPPAPRRRPPSWARQVPPARRR